MYKCGADVSSGHYTLSRSHTLPTRCFGTPCSLASVFPRPAAFSAAPLSIVSTAARKCHLPFLASSACRPATPLFRLSIRCAGSARARTRVVELTSQSRLCIYLIDCLHLRVRHQVWRWTVHWVRVHLRHYGCRQAFRAKVPPESRTLHPPPPLFDVRRAAVSVCWVDSAFPMATRVVHLKTLRNSCRYQEAVLALIA
jgi:hypothetical protein